MLESRTPHFMSSFIKSRRVGSSALAAGELGWSASPIYKTRFGYRVSIDAKLPAYSYPTIEGISCGAFLKGI